MPHEVVISGERDASDVMMSSSIPSNTIIVKEEATRDADAKSDEAVVAKQETQAAAKEDKETPPETAKDGDGEASRETAEAFIVAGVDVTDYSREYAANGKLSEDTYKALDAKGFPRDMVDAYIKGLEQSAADDGAGELAEKEVNAILDEVGGEAYYNKVMEWAAEKLTQDEMDAYDKAVTVNDPAMVRFVVSGLVARYEREHGAPPKLISGNKVNEANVVRGYKDRSSMMDAMKDPRYGNDPDYTREVERKVVASGVMRSHAHSRR